MVGLIGILGKNMNNLDLHNTIPDASALAHEKLDVCLSCEHLTDMNRCGLMKSECFITAVVQWDWKACPANKHPLDEEQAEIDWSEKQKKLEYKNNRKRAYPPIEDFVDAWVKNDDVALEEYRVKCLDVKDKYPKPE